MNSLQEFIERWPEHEYSVKAKRALEILVPEVESKIRKFEFPKERAVAYIVMHEQALAFMQRGDLLNCAVKCEQLLALVPDFASARNNLATAYFQTGRESEAVAVVEGTRKLAPTNRFAEATLAKLYFLTGREQESQQIADHLVAAPPDDIDSFTCALEALALLGRDEDIIALAKEMDRYEGSDDRSIALQVHYIAYAKCRLGDVKGARSDWKKCLALLPSHPDARENLVDLDTGGGHAPWADSVSKWIPRERLNTAIRQMQGVDDHRLTPQYPALNILIPALLDRGDPGGREIAAKLAMIDGNPQLIEGLKKFASGSRGPDKERFEVLTFLKNGNHLEAGSQSFYSKGKWTDVVLVGAEITAEPENLNYSKQVWKMLDEGGIAQKAQDYDRAETIYQKVLTEDPGNCTAIYNQCVIWLSRDGKQGIEKAFERLTKLREDCPDYLMSTIALAQIAAHKGDFQTAHRLTSSVFNEAKLSMTVAISVFIAQVDIAILEKKPDAAQIAYDALLKFAEPNDPRLKDLTRRIDLLRSKNPLRKLFGRS